MPITKAWLFQLILALVLICHSSFRGVVELLRDLFDFHTSVGTIHNQLSVASASAIKINQSQDLSPVDIGLHDEIFHGSKPVLVGIDAASTYCYLLEAAEHRDGDIWGYHLLNAAEQGLDPTHTIADAGSGLRAGQKEAFGGNAEEPPKVVNLKSVCLESIRHMFFRWDVKLNRTVADPRLKVSSYYSTV